MDFDSNQTSVDNNCDYSLAKFVSQTVEETLAQFHKCAIGSISVALWQKQHVYRAVQPAHLPPHTRRADVLLAYNCEDDVTLFNNQRRMNQQRTPTPETQDKVKANLPAHSQERCTQKACRPPSLQRLCNVTVKEKARTLLKGFPRG